MAAALAAFRAAALKGSAPASARAAFMALSPPAGVRLAHGGRDSGVVGMGHGSHMAGEYCAHRCKTLLLHHAQFQDALCTQRTHRSIWCYVCVICWQRSELMQQSNIRAVAVERAALEVVVATAKHTMLIFMNVSLPCARKVLGLLQVTGQTNKVNHLHDAADIARWWMHADNNPETFKREKVW